MFKIFALNLVACALVIPSEASACASPAVSFEYGSTRLSSSDRLQIAGVSREARSIRGSRVKLTVGIDGSRRSLTMARKRVDVIKVALAEGGIPANRVEVILSRASGERTIWFDVRSV